MFHKKLFVSLTLLLLTLFVSALSSADEIGQIRAAIQSSGGQWVAGDTSMTRLAPEERRKRLGLNYPVATLDTKVLSLQEPVLAVPASFDWRSNGGNFVTPVRDQGNCGSCWAFATTAAAESAQLISSSTPGYDLNLSEQLLASCSGAGDCNGGYLEDASDYIRDTGLPLEACYPYTATDYACTPCANWDLSTYRIDSWQWVATQSPTVTALKNALYTYGPLATTMRVYGDFYAYQSGVYSYSYGAYEGGHGVLIVGYDDVGRYFTVKNSWGPDWGEAGYFRIAYSQLDSAVNLGDWTIAYTMAPEPDALTVATPNGGETWTAGVTKTIWWNYAGNPGPSVRIELFKNGMYDRNIVSSASIGTSGIGSYNWPVPASIVAGNDYLVKITSTSDEAIADVSDAPFSIISPGIVVTSPNGGESWAAGTMHPITWSYTGSPGSYVKIELFKGGVFNRTISYFTSVSAGSYNWLVPSTQALGSDYMIKITSTSNSSYSDMSNSSFTITGAPPPSITVASPAGGESWAAGTTHPITWSYTGSPGSYVKIELFKGGVFNRTISSFSFISSGSYNWSIPSTLTSGSDYSIKISSTSNSSYFDFSGTFTITGPPPPSITVASPAGGESWAAGTIRTVSWSYSGSPGYFVKIELYKGGVLNRVIASSAWIGSNGTGTYNWTISLTQTKGSDYQIKITSTTNSSSSDISDATFVVN
ncbi:MAG: C1 family peptidase [Nitrospirota bacterium]